MSYQNTISFDFGVSKMVPFRHFVPRRTFKAISKKIANYALAENIRNNFLFFLMTFSFIGLCVMGNNTKKKKKSISFLQVLNWRNKCRLNSRFLQNKYFLHQV